MHTHAPFLSSFPIPRYFLPNHANTHAPTTPNSVRETPEPQIGQWRLLGKVQGSAATVAEGQDPPAEAAQANTMSLYKAARMRPDSNVWV